MRFSTCRTPISPSIRPKTRSSRSATESSLEQLLLLGDLQRQVRGDRVGELGRLVDLVDRDQHLGRHLLVELDVLLELRDHGARQRLELGALGRASSIDRLGVGLEELGLVGEAARSCARWPPSTSTFTVPSGSFSSCSTVATRADGVDVVGGRDRPGWRSSGRPAGSACRPSSPLRARARLLAADEERHDHVRETRRCRAAAGRDRWSPTAGGVHDASLVRCSELPAPRPRSPNGRSTA